MESLLSLRNGQKVSTGLWGTSEILDINVTTNQVDFQSGWISFSASTGQAIEYEAGDFSLAASQFAGAAILPIADFDYANVVELAPEVYDAMLRNIENPPAANAALRSLFH